MADDRPYEILSHGKPTGLVEPPVDWFLEELIQHMLEREGVWFAIHREAAAYIRAEFGL